MTLDLVYYLVMDGVVLDVAFISKTHCSAFATHVGIPPLPSNVSSTQGPEP